MTAEVAEIAGATPAPEEAVIEEPSIKEDFKKLLDVGLMTNVELLLLAVKVAVGFILAFILAALMRAADWEIVDLAMAGIIAIFGAIFSFAPLFILGGMGVGSVKALSKKTTLSDGLKWGVDWITHVGITVTAFIAMVFGFFGTYPGHMTVAHYAVAFTGPILIVLFQAQGRIKDERPWIWWIGGSYTALVMIWFFIILPFKGITDPNDTDSFNNLAITILMVWAAAEIYFAIINPKKDAKSKQSTPSIIRFAALLAVAIFLFGGDHVLKTTRNAGETVAEKGIVPTITEALGTTTQNPAEQPAHWEAGQIYAADAAYNKVDKLPANGMFFAPPDTASDHGYLVSAEALDGAILDVHDAGPANDPGKQVFVGSTDGKEHNVRVMLVRAPTPGN